MILVKTVAIPARLLRDQLRQFVDRPWRRVLVVAEPDDGGRLPLELAYESACGDEDSARDVLCQVTGEVAVDRRRVLWWRTVQSCLRADVVEHAPAVEADDVRLVLRPGGQSRLRPGAHHV